MNEKKKYGLVLSGGAARGFAHIGVLKALEESGFRPDIISGTSAGALIGSMYAAGKTADEIAAFAKKQTFMKSVKVGWPVKGLSRFHKLDTVLKEFTGVETFEELKIPLKVTVSNIEKGREEVFDSGPLWDIVLASCSIPMLFKPVIINGMTYVDGGLFKNFPASIIRKECDYLVGVNLLPNKEVKGEDLKSITSVASRCFILSVRTRNNEDLSLVDILIEPDKLNEFSLFAFGKFKEIFQLGYDEALKVVHLENFQLNMST
jgi:NTE family protein